MSNRINAALISTLSLFVVTAFADVKTVLVGHAANFSDVSTSAINPYNKSVTNGLDTAVEEYGDQLKKKGLQIKIQNFDYGNKDITALGIAREIISRPVVATIGFYESGQALLAGPELEKAGVPLLSPVASATRLFTIGRFFHPMSFSNQDMGFALVDFAKRRLKAKTLLLVDAIDCAYCADLANAVEAKAKDVGVSIERVNVLNGEPTFEKVDSAVKNKKYDAVVVPNHELTSAKIIGHLMKIGVTSPFLGGDGWGNADGGGFFQIVSDPKFVGYSIGHWHPDLATPLGKTFIARWKKKFGQLPSTDSAMAYDSMRLLILAILKTKNPSRQDIQSALESMPSYEGATGKMTFSEGSAPRKALVLLKSDVKNKRFFPLESFKARD